MTPPRRVPPTSRTTPKKGSQSKPAKTVRVRGFLIVPSVVVDDGVNMPDLVLEPNQFQVQGSELTEWATKVWPKIVAGLQKQVDSGEISG